MIPKAFLTAGRLAPPVPSVTPPSVLQLAQSQLTPGFDGSRGSLLCGSLWLSIYRKTHKHRSHFLSLLLSFLHSQNRPMTPALHLASSLANTSLPSPAPPHSFFPGPQELTSALHRMEGPVKSK